MNKEALSQEAQQGLEFLQYGNIPEAFKQLKKAFQTGEKNPRALLALAITARATSNFEVGLTSIDNYLKVQPRDINANIIKADVLSGLGKIKTATTFYMGVLRLAQNQNAKQISPQLQQDLIRAQQACQKAQELFNAEMEQCVKELNVEENPSGKRLQQAVDIMMGRKQVYPQKPTKFYFPEMPQRQFYEANEFEWAQSIIDGKDKITEELTKVLKQGDFFEPYFSHNPIAPQTSNMSFYNDKSWSSFHLYRDGKEVPENIAQCPETYQLISQAPIPKIPGRSPNILFSLLEPGAYIEPHHGQINIRLLCHLPLIVPQGCYLRVGNDQRDVEEGKLMIFDDTVEHEAKNTSNERRVVLIFDIWRPEIREEEKPVLYNIFNKIESLE